MYGGVHDRRRDSIPSMYAYISYGLYRRLAHAIIYVSILYGTRGRGASIDLSNRLTFQLHFGDAIQLNTFEFVLK